MKKFIFNLSVALITLFFISCDNNNTPKSNNGDNNQKENVISNLVSKLTMKDFSEGKLSMEAILNFNYDKSERISEINIDVYTLDGKSGATSTIKEKIDLEFEYAQSKIIGKQINIDNKGVKTAEHTTTTILDENNKSKSSESTHNYILENYSYKSISEYKYDKNKNIEEILLKLIHEREGGTSKYELKWENANPTFISRNNEICNYTYGNVLNNSNIDLNVYGAILKSSILDFLTGNLSIMNLNLIKSKNLAESFQSSTSDIIYTNKFDLDQNSRVVKITTFSAKGESKEAKKVREIVVSYK